MHDKLLGVEVTSHSPDVEAAFNLFVDIMERRRGSEERLTWWRCGYDDMYFFDGILDDAVIEKRNEWGDTYYDFDRDRIAAYMDEFNFSDYHYAGHTWVVVLTYLLTDYRYLQL